MEIKFAWIEKYKNIEEQGFNFCPKHRFEYNPTTGVLTFQDRSDDVIEVFFGEDFLNVTAIIGENGSGKSNIIELIISRFASFGNGIDMPHNIFGNEIFILDKMIFFTEGVNVTNRNELESLGFDFNSFEESITDCFPPPKFPNALIDINNTYIFYSPSFDHRSLGDRKPNLFDISTNYLIFVDRYFNLSTDIENETIEIYPDLNSHVYAEVKRHLDFIGANIQELPFKLPSYLNIKVPRLTGNRFLEKSQEWIDENNPNFQYLLNFERDLHHNTSGKPEKFKQILACCFLGALMIKYPAEFSRLGNQDLNNWIYNRQMPNQFGNVELNEKLEQVSTYFQILNELTAEVNHGYIDRDRTDSHPEKHEWEVSNEITIEVSDISIERIKKLHDLHVKITGPNPILTYYWGGLSSGERNLLNLFSRLYGFRNYYEDDDNHPDLDNIIVFLDEGASGFHPNWQKEYFSSLIKTLPKMFCFDPEDDSPNGRKIQLILTSHSPFVASNLPKENIIFLKKDADGKCNVVDGLNQMKQTFGANIHTLLSDSFFLDGLIGDFAQGKIDWLVRFLNGEEEMDIDEAEKITGMVGEPLIKRYLEKEMEKLRHSSSIGKLEERIKELETENKALRNDQDQA